MNKALFLTFNDTLIFTRSGRKIPLHSKDWVLNVEILECIKHFYRLDYKIIIVDNEKSVAEGYMDKRVFERKVLDVIEVLEKILSIVINPICYSFWMGDKDDYYKLPNPGLAYEAALEYELDLMNSVMVGNNSWDFRFYSNFGIGKFINTDDLIKEDYKKW